MSSSEWRARSGSDARDHALVARACRRAAPAARRRCRPAWRRPRARARRTGACARRGAGVDVDLEHRFGRRLQAHGHGVEAEQDAAAHRRWSAARSRHGPSARAMGQARVADAVAAPRCVSRGHQPACDGPTPSQQRADQHRLVHHVEAERPAAEQRQRPQGARHAARRRTRAPMRQQPLAGGQAPQHHAEPGQQRREVLGDRLARDQADPVRPAAVEDTGAAASAAAAMRSSAERPQPARRSGAARRAHDQHHRDAVQDAEADPAAREHQRRAGRHQHAHSRRSAPSAARSAASAWPASSATACARPAQNRNRLTMHGALLGPERVDVEVLLRRRACRSGSGRSRSGTPPSRRWPRRAARRGDRGGRGRSGRSCGECGADVAARRRARCPLRSLHDRAYPAPRRNAEEQARLDARAGRPVRAPHHLQPDPRPGDRIGGRTRAAHPLRDAARAGRPLPLRPPARWRDLGHAGRDGRPCA